MGRIMFLEDVFLGSETDIAFLNSFGMRAAFDGVDLFPPCEAAFIRSMAPSRIRVLGTVDPPDGASAIESLIYQCETIKIDGLKLYPPGPDTRSWVLGDEKNTYPLFGAYADCKGAAVGDKTLRDASSRATKAFYPTKSGLSKLAAVGSRW